MDYQSLQADFSTEKKRILIVEDNIESQLIFKVYLRQKYLVDIVATAEEGIQFIKNNEFDLILLDINLPGELNGVDVLNEIRSNLKFKELPVIVITAYALKGDKEKFLNIGANDFIAKPITKDTLIQEIEKFLN